MKQVCGLYVWPLCVFVLLWKRRHNCAYFHHSMAKKGRSILPVYFKTSLNHLCLHFWSALLLARMWPDVMSHFQAPFLLLNSSFFLSNIQNIFVGVVLLLSSYFVFNFSVTCERFFLKNRILISVYKKQNLNHDWHQLWRMAHIYKAKTCA